MRILLLISVTWFFTACTSQYQISHGTVDLNQINSQLSDDEDVEQLIAPYREQIQEEMNTVIGEVTAEMHKSKPESTLGNWFCDAMLDYTNALHQEDYDFAINNYGGIRIPSLAKGPLTVGKIYELMPFDNMLVVLKVDGKTLRKLFEMFAEKNGWPMSRNVQLTIKEKKIFSLSIKGAPLEEDKIYTVVTSDYVANGGDAAYFLKQAELKETGVLLRDALIEQAKQYTADGQSIHSELDKRIKVIN